MSLTTHPYRFFSDKQVFLEAWGAFLKELTGERLLCVWGVWDTEGETWFDEAPMLVELTSGILSVHVKSESDLAVGWNDLFYSHKPVWFDEDQIREMPDLNWQEDLIWKKYDAVDRSFGSIVRKIEPLQNNCGLRGILVSLEGGKLCVYDAGDVIAANYTAS